MKKQILFLAVVFLASFVICSQAQVGPPAGVFVFIDSFVGAIPSVVGGSVSIPPNVIATQYKTDDDFLRVLTSDPQAVADFLTQKTGTSITKDNVIELKHIATLEALKNRTYLRGMFGGCTYGNVDQIANVAVTNFPDMTDEEKDLLIDQIFQLGLVSDKARLAEAIQD